VNSFNLHLRFEFILEQFAMSATEVIEPNCPELTSFDNAVSAASLSERPKLFVCLRPEAKILPQELNGSQLRFGLFAMLLDGRQCTRARSVGLFGGKVGIASKFSWQLKST